MEINRLIKLRIDGHLALLVDEAPLPRQVATNANGSKSVAELVCTIKLRIDDHLACRIAMLCH